MKIGSIVASVFGVIFRVVAAVFIAYAIYRGSVISFEYGYRIFTEPAVSAGEGRAVTVAITEDMSPADIGRLFESKGLVQDGRLFMLQYYLSEFREDVGPGIFELRTSMTAEEMMEAMVVPHEDDEEGESE